MFKTISAELKKKVSKPGIFILSLLLAIILVFGVFLYQPKAYESSEFELAGNTYLDKWNEFMGDATKGQKAAVDTELDNALLSVKNYTYSHGGTSYSYKEYIESHLTLFQQNMDAYRDSTSDESAQTTINNLKTSLVKTLEEINQAVETGVVNYQLGSYAIIATNTNYQGYRNSYTALHDWLDQTISKENLSDHFVEYDSGIANNFFKYVSKFKYPTLTTEMIKDYSATESGTKYSILLERRDAIVDEIETNYDLATDDPTFNSNNAKIMDELANKYVATLNVYVNLVKNELLVNAFSQVSTTEQMNLVNLGNYSRYNCNSLLERYNYIFEHNKLESDYSLPLTIGIASNNEANGYDYAYFVLRVFSFVLIVYAIMSCCHSIAGEIKEGSMRYLAIRPVSRTKLFFGKWLAVIIMNVILMVFSLIISVSVGAAVYGMQAANILTIFNGTTPLVLHPIGMLAIYLFSMLLELMIYSLLAMMLSVWFKSDLLGVTILLVLYLLNTLFPMFIQGANSWLNFYPFSHISMYALFGSSLYAQSGNFMNLVFGAKIYAASNIALTLGLILLMIIIICVVSLFSFKRKEL